jgi:hypothetical protein
MVTSPFSRMFASQLKAYGLNPTEWNFDTWVCLRERSFMIRHRDDSDFKLKGCLARGLRSKWRLESLAVASI